MGLSLRRGAGLCFQIAYDGVGPESVGPAGEMLDIGFGMRPAGHIMIAGAPGQRFSAFTGTFEPFNDELFLAFKIPLEDIEHISWDRNQVKLRNPPVKPGEPLRPVVKVAEDENFHGIQRRESKRGPFM